MRRKGELVVKTAEIEYFPPGWSDAHRLALEAAQRIVDFGAPTQKVNSDAYRGNDRA